MKIRDEYYPWPEKNAPPSEYLHPSCPGCGRVWHALEAQKSIGGASVYGPYCRRCEEQLREKE